MSKRSDGGGMSARINDGEPAFPVSTRPTEVEQGYGHQDSASTWQYSGMALRDYFAAQALPAVHAEHCAGIARKEYGWEPNWQEGVAVDAYRMADAMLLARKSAGDIHMFSASISMFEALEEIADVAEQVDSWPSFPVGPIEKARAALAIAKGEA